MPWCKHEWALKEEISSIKRVLKCSRCGIEDTFTDQIRDSVTGKWRDKNETDLLRA